MTDKADLLPCSADMLAMAEKLDFERQHLEDGFAFTATQRVMINAATMLRAIARAPSREAELREALTDLMRSTANDAVVKDAIKAAWLRAERALSGSAPVQPRLDGTLKEKE